MLEPHPFRTSIMEGQKIPQGHARVLQPPRQFHLHQSQVPRTCPHLLTNMANQKVPSPESRPVCAKTARVGLFLLRLAMVSAGTFLPQPMRKKKEDKQLGQEPTTWPLSKPSEGTWRMKSRCLEKNGWMYWKLSSVEMASMRS